MCAFHLGRTRNDPRVKDKSLPRSMTVRHFACWGMAIVAFCFAAPLSATELDKIVDAENKAAGVKQVATPVVGDRLAFQGTHVSLSHGRNEASATSYLHIRWLAYKQFRPSQLPL